MKRILAALLLFATTAGAQTIITADNIPCAQQPFTLYATSDIDTTLPCKYNQTTDAAYESMSGTFSGSGTSYHTTSLTLSCAESYVYHIRCEGDTMAATPAALQIRFDVLSGTPAGGTNRSTSGVKKFSGGKIR